MSKSKTTLTPAGVSSSTLAHLLEKGLYFVVAHHEELGVPEHEALAAIDQFPENTRAFMTANGLKK